MPVHHSRSPCADNSRLKKRLSQNSSKRWARGSPFYFARLEGDKRGVRHYEDRSELLILHGLQPFSVQRGKNRTAQQVIIFIIHRNEAMMACLLAIFAILR